MALVYDIATNATPAQYERIWDGFRAAGADRPKGLLFHVGFLDGETVRVIDLWESEADFDAFGAVLGPIVAEVGNQPTWEVSEALYFQSS